MNLNVSGNMNTIGASRLAGAAVSEAHKAKGGRAPSSAATDFIVTRTVVPPEEIEAAAIPGASLSRGDALGLLVGTAFALPPPPMPDFANIYRIGNEIS